MDPPSLQGGRHCYKSKALCRAQPECVPREFASTGYTRMRQTILKLGAPPERDALPALRPSTHPAGLPRGIIILDYHSPFL
ncbi:hypothetical protein CEXT_607161 [Caerostris extrusa]|uniref:Uncharacterized protein n=1 Tax=Caerostris extrusa TaxID=172846 RepID=A0AAV4NJ17_CAEEX|nr:hypothetical protein CEXT_607161 [Caerostris extrusa]